MRATIRDMARGSFGARMYRAATPWIGVAALAWCAGARVAAAAGYSGSLPVLTTIGAVHRLSYKKASLAYPVHVHGMITYYDPFLNHPRRPIVMVTDRTGSIYVALPGETTMPLHAGALVDVQGVSGPGEFAPTIDRAEIHITGQSTLPAHGPRRTMAHLLTGAEDAQWSEMEGVVESVDVSGNNITLKLGLSDGELAATTVREEGADYASLIDAKVLVRGIAGSLFNRQSQIIGVQLLFPGLAALRVEEAAPQHPYQLPVTPIRELMRYAPEKMFNRRVHLHGSVTLFWPGRLLCLQDGAGALCASTAQTTPLVVGQAVDVIGFPAIGSVTPTLSDASFEAREETSTAAISRVDADQAFGGDHDARLVEMDGWLIAQDKAARDPTLVLSSGKFTFPVILPNTLDASALRELPEGSKIRVTGICSVQADSKVFTRHDGFPVTKYFQIMLRSPSDVVVVQRPSWWNAGHTLYVLALALALTLGVLCWVVFLRMRVKEQTELLRHQATHDGLTGIWNRRAVLQLLQREFEMAARESSSIGLMMLDADHFKQVNDTYGHLAGDAVLKELVKRIQHIMRSSDLIGRYGGEEFLVVTPGCMADEAFSCAERVRAAIAEGSIQAEGAELIVTVSVGITVLDPRFHTQDDALAAADRALYEAKKSGRNRVVVGGVMALPKDTGMQHGVQAFLTSA